MAKKSAKKKAAPKRSVTPATKQAVADLPSLGPIVDAIDRVHADIVAYAAGRKIKPETLRFLSELRARVTTRCRATAKKPAPLKHPSPCD